LVQDVQEGTIRLDEIDEASIAERLYQPGPDPDLIIRTAGEMRLSNFLLWEASYAEFYSTPLCWPAFKEKDLHEAILEYNRRTRKYGGLLKSGDKKSS
ncbi:MAG: undecaprenyl diphosphate synthase family protein, partial [Planctomycetes bacterium]|nr:undecaprenyl diphosphate synthase family protein [Planctomycetota bacterium]